MKSFLSSRAGGSFFCGSNRTVVYHKDKEYETIAPLTLPFRQEIENNALIQLRCI